MNLQKHLSVLIAVLFPVVSGMAATATCKDGWASITGTCGPETTVQKAIVARANNSIGGNSGQSTACHLSSGCWLTDADPPPGPPNDGDLMRNALHAYFVWYGQNQKTRPSLAALRSTMAGMLIHYTPSDASKMAVQMTSYACPATDPTGSATRWSNDQLLAFIGIRKQCLEWAITTAVAAGGAALNYTVPSFSTLNRVRPGMGLYDPNHHAMIIVDVLWKNNLPVGYQVVEANYDTAAAPAWPSNDPPGQVPWLRTVDRRPSSIRDSRGLPTTSSPVTQLSGYRLVNYEPNSWK